MKGRQDEREAVRIEEKGGRIWGRYVIEGNR